MASMTLSVPPEYGYVVAVAAASLFTSFWHGMRVGQFRRAAGVPYPIPYALRNLDAAYQSTGERAKAEHLFNCAQRAHGNYLENYPIFLVALFIAGLTHPTASAAAGVAWLVTRIVYAVGYTSPTAEKGKGRLAGGIPSNLITLGLSLLASKASYDIVQAGRL